MEINITQFYTEAAPMDYSASVAEIGNNAGADTWNAAKEDSEEYSMLKTQDEVDAFIEHMIAIGFSEGEEMCQWKDKDLQALFIQLVAGDMREMGGMSWEEYEVEWEAGNIGGCLYRGDDNQIYYYLGY